MALATSQLRSHYSPACTGKGDRYHGAYASLNTCLHHHRYQPRRGVTGAYNCRKITGGSGYSLHAYGPGGAFTFWAGVSIATSLAVDINWDENPYGPRLVTDMPRAMIDDIYRIRTNSGAQVWRWGGYYRTNKDAMHFEIVCSPADLATGIDPRTITGAQEDDMPITDDDANKIAEKVWQRTLTRESVGMNAPAVLVIGDIFHHARRGAISSGADVDEVAIAQEILAHLDPEKIAAAIPLDLADKVADVLAARLRD